MPTIVLTHSVCTAYLPYLNLSNTGVDSVQLPQLDDGLSGQIDIPDGLPFGSSHPIAVWVRHYMQKMCLVYQLTACIGIDFS